MPTPDAPPRPHAHRARASRLTAFGAAAILAVFAPRMYAQMRVAVVDIQRALLETEQGRRAKNQLRTLFERRQVELDGRQQALRRMREDLERQRNTLPRDEMARRMEDYQRQFVDLQQNFLQYQQELAQREAEMTKQIYSNLQGVIRQIGAAESYTAVFEQSGVVWSPQHLDLTDRVVQAYNQQFPSREDPAPAAAGDGGVAHPASGGASGGGASGGGARDGGARPFVNPHPREDRQSGGGGGQEGPASP